ncbi:MAG: putative transport system permease protein [Blastocatellia bacterium]|nr:putative transport system permease protein [Blastocatellia bacterium]
MENLIADLRYAARTLIKTPAFLLVSVLTLALGIGGNIAIFTLVQAVLLQPLPFPQPERLVRIFDNRAGARDVGMSVPEFEDLRRHSDIFEQISVIFPAPTALTGGERVERVEMLGTSPSYFDMLRAKPALGRAYTQADWVPGVVDGVVISDALWKRQFGGDPNVIGKRIRLDEDGYTIIGVMPPDFRHPGKGLIGDVELWSAAGFVALPYPVPPNRGLRFIPGAMGRLKPGLSIKEAQQRLDAFVRQLQQSYPNDYPNQSRWELRIEPVQSSLTGEVRPMLIVLLAAVAFVLLIVCVNVATLLIARSLTRMREFAIRQALGASRSRLVRQVLTESVLISLTGAAAALLVLRFARGSLLASLPQEVPRLNEIHGDWRVIALALVLSVFSGILFGLGPAFHATMTNPNHDLKEGGRTGGQHGIRQSRSRAALVTLEVALSVVLLISAGLLIRSFSAMLRERPGIDPRGVTVAQIWIPVPNSPDANHYLNPPQRARLARELVQRLEAAPGVPSVAVGLSTNVPFLSNVRNLIAFSFPDSATSAQEEYTADYGAVSPNYFDLLKLPLRKGRVFTDHDDYGATNVVVVNEAFARKFFPQQDPIGQHVRDSKRTATDSARTATDSEIIGVVGDVLDHGLDQPPEPRLYGSILQRSAYRVAVFLRTSANLTTTRQLVTRTMEQIDPELPVYGVTTMDELISSSMARRRLALFLMSTFAALALFLAGLGIYGVTAFLVKQRVQEFGIRMALGAQIRDILLLAVRPGLVLVSIGAAAGLVVSMFVTRLMSSLLFAVSSTDPFTFITVPLVLAIVAVIACLIPARYATRISPAEALRH